MVRLLNIGTNPLNLPVITLEDELYEEFEFDENSGGHVKKIKSRKKPVGSSDVWVDGAHHERPHEPGFTHVSNETFEGIKAGPGFVDLLKENKLQIVMDVDQKDAKAYEAQRKGE